MTGRGAAALDSLAIEGERISARLRLEGDEHRIAYRVAGVPLEPRYEPFLVAALPIAMRRATALSLPHPISARLLGALPTVQRILSAWDSRMHPIEVKASPQVLDPEAERGVASFFSGGVDSFYTATRKRDELDALVYVRGFDLPLELRLEQDRVAHSLRIAAESLGAHLIEVETNLKRVSKRHCGWMLYHGALLASVALLIGSSFGRVLVPASHSYRDLFPWGSHPLLDPLWSTEAVEIVHEGVARRPEKLAELAGSEVAMRHLRVCWTDASGGNCGRCEKCLRTMVGLRIVGALDRCATLPHRIPISALYRTPIRGESDLGFARENRDAAHELGADPGLKRALGWMERRGTLYQALKPRRRGRATGLLRRATRALRP